MPVIHRSWVAQPWEAVVPSVTHIPVLTAHMNTHTWRHTPPTRPPGLDDPLNSSNYQALTDRQIRSELGCWGLHRQTDRKSVKTSNMAAPDIYGKGVEDAERGKGEMAILKRLLPLITGCLCEAFIRPN